jgi:GMP synthase (glutamine-hydrolysing)
MRIHALQHAPFEGLGNIQTWADECQHTVTITKLFVDEQLPSVASFDALLVLGGPMNIYEESQYKWLKEEKSFIKRVIHEHKYVLGICLGAQLIADVLGAKVYQGKEKEIGWFPVTLSDEVEKRFPFLPKALEVFHWHGDTFDLPIGATLLASSKACINQAFLYNERVIGLQFHLEMTKESIELMIENCKDELQEQRLYVQNIDEINNQYDKVEYTKTVLYTLLDHLFPC